MFAQLPKTIGVKNTETKPMKITKLSMCMCGVDAIYAVCILYVNVLNKVQVGRTSICHAHKYNRICALSLF